MQHATINSRLFGGRVSQLFFGIDDAQANEHLLVPLDVREALFFCRGTLINAGAGSDSGKWSKRGRRTSLDSHHSRISRQCCPERADPSRELLMGKSRGGSRGGDKGKNETIGVVESIATTDVGTGTVVVSSLVTMFVAALHFRMLRRDWVSFR